VVERAKRSAWMDGRESEDRPTSTRTIVPTCRYVYRRRRGRPALSQMGLETPISSQGRFPNASPDLAGPDEVVETGRETRVALIISCSSRPHVTHSGRIIPTYQGGLHG
jgi:hypothetical protein